MLGDVQWVCGLQYLLDEIMYWEKGEGSLLPSQASVVHVKGLI